MFVTYSGRASTASVASNSVSDTEEVYMRSRLLLPVMVIGLVAGPLVSAQTPSKPSPQTSKTGPSATGPDRARLGQVLAAWATMDPSKAAPFYAKDPGLIFYDIAPRKYSGWAEYAKGTTEMFKTVKSLTMKLNEDAQVHNAGSTVWTTATVDGEMVNNDGTRLKIDARWTCVWEKRGTDWLIVHEHFSMPLPEPPPPKK
jgi:ketosteroid isomerase-like protein